MQTQNPKDGDKVPGTGLRNVPLFLHFHSAGFVISWSRLLFFLAFWLAHTVTYLVHLAGSALYPVKKL